MGGSDILHMAHIAECEGGTQFHPDGTVVRGIVNPHDIGIYQINERYHKAKAESLGYNIYTLEGNTEYAFYLHMTQGDAPWAASKPCWAKLDAGESG